MVVGTGQQHGARGRTGGGGVEVREARAGARQPVDVRRADLAAEAAGVREAQVIGEDYEEVGLLGGGHCVGLGWM